MSNEVTQETEQPDPLEPWNRNSLQFARLLAEIRAVGLSQEQMEELSVSMDLDHPKIEELLERAENEWEEIKDAVVEHPGTVYVSGEAATIAEALVGGFLEGMPELGIRADCPNEQQIVDECHDGDVRTYIRDSFGNYLDQCF